MYTKPILGQQINWAHPLAKGLVGCWVMNEGSGDRIYDLSNNGNNGVFENDPLWVPGGLCFDDIHERVIIANSPKLQLFSEITIFSKFNSTDLSDDVSRYHTLVAKRNDDVDADNINYELRVGTDYNIANDPHVLHFAYRVAGNWHLWDTGVNVTGLGINVDKDIAVTFKYGVGTSIQMYLDGISKTILGSWKVGNGNTAPSSTSNDVGIAETIHDTAPGGAFLGTIYVAYIYNRSLTPQEIQQLHQEPYAMFTRDEIELDYKYFEEEAVYNSIFFGMNF